MDESKCDTGERLDNNVNDVIMTSNMKSLPEDDLQRLHIYAFKVYALQQSKSLVSRCFKRVECVDLGNPNPDLSA